VPERVGKMFWGSKPLQIIKPAYFLLIEKLLCSIIAKLGIIVINQYLLSRIDGDAPVKRVLFNGVSEVREQANHNYRSRS
jgi:hypothetical protein